jgi:hypothetical protein
MKSYRRSAVLIILISLLPLISMGQKETDADLIVRLGVSQINITPDIPLIMSGYDARETPFTGIHDSLYASALFFSSEKNKVLIITTDLIGFRTEMADEIKKKISSEINIPADNIMLTAVHNHGGPAIQTYEDKLPSANDNYVSLLKEKLTGREQRQGILKIRLEKKLSLQLQQVHQLILTRFMARVMILMKLWQ